MGNEGRWAEWGVEGGAVSEGASARLERPDMAESGRAVALVGRVVLREINLLLGPNTPFFGSVAKYWRPSMLPSFLPRPYDEPVSSSPA